MRKKPTDNYKKYNSRRHKVVPPEEMVVGKTYSFSYNPVKQPYQMLSKIGNSMVDLITWHNYNDMIFKSMKNCKIRVVPEISSSRRWHYHGMIEITDVMKFFIEDLYKMNDISSYEIDEINDLEKWSNYCSKQEKIMKPYCQKYGIPYEYDCTKPMKVKSDPLRNPDMVELVELDYDSDESLGD